MQIVLASSSPQRVRLMREAGYDFESDPADIDETDLPAGLDAVGVAKYLALAKARTVAQRHADACVIGADTVVALGETLLGKPADADDARRMLSGLSGTTHRVITGVAVVSPAAEAVDHSVSEVTMRALTDQELNDYVASGEWRGKAGGYGIQDPDPFVTCVSGAADNVVGLPMDLVETLLTPSGGPP
ncbi:MAG TPA: Maf family protein [Tepidisphaeraceae bacterium]|jgi:septum formation protein